MVKKEKIVEFIKASHTSGLELMSIEKDGRVRMGIRDINGRALSLHTSRLLMKLANVDMDKVNFGKDVKITGHLKVEITGTVVE